jgi:hypothetical protein
MKLGLAGNHDVVRLGPSIRADDHLTEPPLISADVYVPAEVDLGSPNQRRSGHTSSATYIFGMDCRWVARKHNKLKGLAERVGFEPRLSNEINKLEGANGTSNL